MKRVVIIGTFVFAVIAGASWGVWRYAGLSGVSPVEGWIREYLVTVLRRHLNPQVEIGELDYEYPRTVVVSQLRLTESGLDILVVKQARLELAEIPQTGKPILIERIDLTGPTVQLVKTPGGKLVGWSNLMRHDAGLSDDRVEPGMRVSDFMRLRHAVIRDGSLAHRPDANRSEMVLAGINADLETPVAAEGLGWYRLIGTLSREELFRINLDGRVDVNTGDLVLSSLHVQGALDDSRYSVFPASLQDFLRAHQVQGSLALEVSGAWSQSVVEQCKLKLTARLENTRFAQGPRVLTSDRVDVGADIDGDRIEVNAKGDVLEGMAEARFRTDLSDAQSGKLTVGLEKVDFALLAGFMPEAVQQTLDSMQAKGRISGEVHANIPQTGSEFEVRGNASIVPLTFQLNGSDVEAENIALNGTFAKGKLGLDVTADALKRGAERLATSVRVNVSVEPSATVIATQLNAAGGRIQSDFHLPSGDSEGLRFSSRLDRVRIEEASTLFRAFSLDMKSPLSAGELTGDLQGVWNPTESRPSSISGNLSLAAGQLNVFATTLAVSTPSMNLKYSTGHLDLDGRLNAVGGVIALKLGVDLQNAEGLTTSGKLESVSLATLLVATGQRWNSPVVGGPVLDARLTGDFDLKFPSGSSPTGRVFLEGTQGHVRLGSIRIPIDKCKVDAELRDREIAAQVQMNLLAGRAEMDGIISLVPHGAFRAGWQVNDIQLESLGRIAGGPNPGRYRGRLSGDGDIQFSLSTWPTSLKGRGRLDIRQGRLIEFPVIHDILKVVRPVLSLVSPADQDAATANFKIQPDAVEIDGFDVSSSLMAIRGRGRVNYDGRLQLVVRAAPTPGMTSLLGPLDKVFDDVSGRLMTYRVDGTVQQPRVSIEPLGFSVRPGE